MQNRISSAKSSFRLAGWSAILSGVFGILAIAILLYAVFSRTTWELTDEILLLFNTHNLLSIFQMLLLIPLVFAFQKLSRTKPPEMSRTMLIIGVTALGCTALFHLLYFPKILSDEYYMIPQGVFGAWLIVISYQLSGIFSRVLRWFGIVVGVGLLLVGLYEIGFGIFVDPTALRIPAPDFSSMKDPGPTMANLVVHRMLDVGSFLGVLPLPILSIILGRKLLKT